MFEKELQNTKKFLGMILKAARDDYFGILLRWKPQRNGSHSRCHFGEQRPKSHAGGFIGKNTAIKSATESSHEASSKPKKASSSLKSPVEVQPQN